MYFKILIFFIGLFSLSNFTYATHFAYLPDQKNNSVQIVDLDNKSWLTEVPVGLKPYGVAVSPQGDRVYITNSSSRTVSIIDTSTNKNIANIGVGDIPIGIVSSFDGRRVYVALLDSNSIAVLDAEKMKLLTVFKTQSISPLGIALSQQSNRLYITNFGTNDKNGEISIFDTSNDNFSFKGKLNLSAQVGGHSKPVAITTYDNKIYVSLFDHALSRNYRILLLEEDLKSPSQLKLVEIENTGTNPNSIAVSENGRKIYVSSAEDKKIFVHDASTLKLLRIIDVAAPSQGVAVLSSSLYVPLGDFFSGVGIQDLSNLHFFSIGFQQSDLIAFGNFIGPEMKSEIYLSSKILSFSEQATETFSEPKIVDVNVRYAPDRLTSMRLTGSDFVFSAGATTCNTEKEMKPGEGCSIGILFKPTSEGKKTAFLSLVNHVGEEQKIELTGVATKKVDRTEPPQTSSDPSSDSLPAHSNQQESLGCSLNTIEMSSHSRFSFLLLFFVLASFYFSKRLKKVIF